MQQKTRHRRLPGPANHLILDQQTLCRERETAAVDRPAAQMGIASVLALQNETVLARREAGALAVGPAADPEGTHELALIEIVEGQGVVRLGGAGIGTASAGPVLVDPGVEDHPLAAGAPDEGEDVGMGVGHQPVRPERAAVDEERVVAVAPAVIARSRQGDMRRLRRHRRTQLGVNGEAVARHIGHGHAGVVEQRGKAIGLGRVAQRRGHAVEGLAELLLQRPGFQHLIAFQEIGEDLRMIRRRALVVHAVAQYLGRDLLAQQLAPQAGAAGELGIVEEGTGPEQRLDVLHQVIAADIALQVRVQEADLLTQRVEDGGLVLGRKRAAMAGKLLHPDHDTNREAIGVPGGQPVAGAIGRVFGRPVGHQGQ